MRGFSTLEAVLSLLILSLILALSFPSLQLVKATRENHQHERRESLPVERAVQDLGRELRAARSLFAFPPQILSPKETSRLARRNALSSGLLLAVPAPERALRAVEFSPYHLCTTDPQWGESKGWVGVSVDGFSLLRGNLLLSHLSTNTECRGAIPLDGSFTEIGGEGAPPNIQLLFPLRDLSLFYLAEEGTVRRVSLLTGEHQPIVSGITQLSFELASQALLRPPSNKTPPAKTEEVTFLRITAQKGKQQRSFLQAVSPPVSPPDLL